MYWIKEVEIAKSIGELMTSRSIAGRTDFRDYDMLDAMIASALKKLFDMHVHFRRRVSVEDLERKAEIAIQGKSEARRRLSDAEVDLERNDSKKLVPLFKSISALSRGILTRKMKETPHTSMRMLRTQTMKSSVEGQMRMSGQQKNRNKRK